MLAHGRRLRSEAGPETEAVALGLLGVELLERALQVATKGARLACQAAIGRGAPRHELVPESGEVGTMSMKQPSS